MRQRACDARRRTAGSGAHHGEHGFARFSHLKPVLAQSWLTPTRLLAPPYGRTFERALALLRRASSPTL
jgi:hypothetical protein